MTPIVQQGKVNWVEAASFITILLTLLMGFYKFGLLEARVEATAERVVQIEMKLDAHIAAEPLKVR